MFDVQEVQAPGVLPSKIPYGLCQCGCGEKTLISRCSCTEKKWIKGVPRRFLHGHNIGQGGAGNSQWKGGKHISKGYHQIYCPDHQRKKAFPYVPEHVLIAERVLGKYLPPRAVIHHVDENGLNNANNNLVICENDPYHIFLHQRIRAYGACGHANWRKCRICHQYDDPVNLSVPTKKGVPAYHKKCASKYQRERKAK
jgi:hypothetical protein